MTAHALTRRLAREPLVHFLVLGALVFAFTAVRRPATARAVAADDDRIVVGSADVARLAERFRAQTGRAPDAAEQERLVAAWTDDEVLFREALALGLHRGDEDIRERLVRKMRMLQRAPADSWRPDDAELERYFVAHRERYTLPPRRDLEQLFVPGAPDQAAVRAGAAALLARVEAGEDPARLGAGHRAGRRLRRRSRDALERELGARFADAVLELPVGRWSIVTGDEGLHVVRVTEIHAAQAPPWTELRETVLRDLRAARAEEIVRAETAALRAGYRVSVEATR